MNNHEEIQKSHQTTATKTSVHPETSRLADERNTRRRMTIKSYAQKANERRTFIEKFADWMTNHFGTVVFLLINLVVYLLWIGINTELVPIIPSFDPYPFGLLTMTMSIEAIVLAIIVLISQNREGKIAEVREELSLQVDMITEEEVTKILKMLGVLLEKQGVDLSEDLELQSMLQPLKHARIEERLEKQLNHND